MDGTQKRKSSQDGSSSAKRARNDDGTSVTFEEELASLGEVSIRNPQSKWPRPTVPKINCSTDNIVFQQLEVDNYIGLYLFLCFILEAWMKTLQPSIPCVHTLHFFKLSIIEVDLFTLKIECWSNHKLYSFYRSGSSV